MDHAGLAGLYLDSLGPWRRMMELGLTTWAEVAEPTRSDDHAWSAHPNYDLLTLVAGIRPASPGFGTVLVAPHPGALTALDARMPHPAGDIVVRYRKTGDAWRFQVSLPPGVAAPSSGTASPPRLAPGPTAWRRLHAEYFAGPEEARELDLAFSTVSDACTTLRIISVPKSPRIVPLGALRESVGPAGPAPCARPRVPRAP